MEVRCASGKLHLVLVEPGLIEVKCDRPSCGSRSGVVVLHRFDAASGKLLETLRFAEPPKGKVVEGGCR